MVRFKYIIIKKGHIDQSFIKKGFTNWKGATEAFRLHEKSQCHIDSVISWEHLKKGIPIDVRLDKQKVITLATREKIRLENREIIKRLIDVIIVLTKSGSSFRGHLEHEDSVNKGLFLEIVDLLKRYDPIIKNHLEHGPKNAQYLSGKIQNELIASVHNVMFQEICKRLNGQQIAVMADETSDCGHIEQMAIVIRYFDDVENKPIELFISLERLETTDAQSIFNVLNTIVHKLKLDWLSVSSVCFDGAAAMAGHISGVQSRCKEKNSKILYVHCFSHCLNLVLVNSCISRKENSMIFDFFGTVQIIYNFIEGSPSRHAVFKKIQKSVGVKLKTLKSLSTTRWACRAETVTAIRDNFSVIIQTVNEINYSTKQPEIKAKGKGIISQCLNFNFIICLELMHPILQLIVKVSRVLQDPGLSILTALEEIKCLRLAIENMRSDSLFYDDIYDQSQHICEEHGVNIPSIRPRKLPARRDENWQNQFVFETKKEEIRVTTMYPLIDSLVQGIDERFSQESTSIITGVGKMLKFELNKDDINLLTNHFDLSKDEFVSEIYLLKARNKDDILTNKDCAFWLKWLRENGIETIFFQHRKVLKGFSVIPVTSASCERAFSKLTHIKTKLRMTMTQGRLENLMLPYIEQTMAKNVDINDVIEEFKKMVPYERRLAL